MKPPLVVVLGVSGSGKTTVASALAARLGLPFLDADLLHSPESIAKMRSGEPLDDRDRSPWLDRAGGWLSEHEPTGGVLACSALRRSYRDQLRAMAQRTRLVELTVGRSVLEQRLATRSHPFMPASLLASQLATFEPLQPGEPGIAIESDQPLRAIVDACLTYLEDE